MKRKMELIPLVMILLVLTCCHFSEAAEAVMINSQEYDSLEKGNVIQKSVKMQLRGGIKGTESKILINAPAKKVWDVIDNKENLPRFVRQIKKAHILEDKNDQQKVDATVKLCDLLPSFKYILVFDNSEKYRRMKFKRIEGSFKELYGYFEIHPYKNKTVLAYRIYSDPGFFIPDFISNAMRGDATSIMKAIKKEAEK